eukprot:COSAG02_NODE_8523_length_2537_cov_34.997539_3_plen_104_part_00
MKLAVLSLCAGFSTAFECQNCQSTVMESSGTFTQVRLPCQIWLPASLPDKRTMGGLQATGTVFAVVVGGGAGGGNSAAGGVRDAAPLCPCLSLLPYTPPLRIH